MSAIIKQYIRAMPYLLTKPNIESDAYNNCLLIQKCIDTLQKQGLLSKMEEDILVAVFYGFNYSEIAKLLSITRHTASLIFDKITDRVEYIIGGDLSDASLLDILEERDLDSNSFSEKDL